jgi:catechol 2,3-dioxygenase
MINRLSHVEIAVTDLGRSKDFYCGVLGLVASAESESAIWLRAPDEFDVGTLKLSLDDEAGLLTFGFRVDREERLDELATLHASLGLPSRWVEAGAEPGRGRALRVRVPSGHIVDFQHQIDEVPLHDGQGVRLPMRNTHRQIGAAPMRLDHVNLRVNDVPRSLEYWCQHLNFSASEMQVDRNGRPQRAWLRRATSSHDLVVAEDDVIGFHHLAYAMRDANTVVRAADFISDAGWPAIEYGPGRHGVSDAYFLYLRDPDGLRVELFAGDYVRDLDRPPILWQLDEYLERGLVWWGQKPPASFLLAGSVLERDLVGEHAEVGLAGSAEIDGGSL